MKILKYTIFAVAMLIIASCKQEQYSRFSDKARIQFGPDIKLLYEESYSLTDTLKPYTFTNQPIEVTQDSVFFDIYALGGVTNTDRTFTLQQELVPNTLNAIPGTHYIDFNDSKATKNFVIKAGTAHTKVPIILLRDPSLKTSAPILKFNVVADVNFQTGELNKLWRKIVLTDRLSRPKLWTEQSSTFLFGKYSVTKHQFFIDNSGEKWDDEFLTFLSRNNGYQNYMINTIKVALINYNNAHPEDRKRDEDRELIMIP